MIFFMVRGAHRGMIRIIYSLVAWIFLLLFVNYGKVYVADYIKIHTEIPTRVENAIDGHLHTKYEHSEAEEVGSGRDAVLYIVPEFAKDDIETSIENSIDNIIKAVAKELSDAAINGISNILLIAVGIIICVIGIVGILGRRIVLPAHNIMVQPVEPAAHSLCLDLY